MAEEQDPAHDSSSQAPLEARVARLEQALAALQREIDTRAAAPSGMARAEREVTRIEVVATAAVVSSPPPPPPLAAPAKIATAMPPKFGTGAARADESAASLESRIGSQVLNRIAIVALLVGAAYGLKLAVDYGWLGPVARVAIGLAAGAALVLWSERFRAKGFATFSYSLKAVGTGVLYLSLWAAFRLFHLIPAPAALVLMIVVTAWNAFMAWAQDSELLAAYAIAGGFATPALLSTGGNHEIFLFTYVLAIDVATVALVRLRGWPRLLLGAFPLTVGYFVGWYVQFWTADALGVTAIFIALFAATFASVPLGPRATDSADVTDRATTASRALKRSTLLEDILLPLANAAFAGLAFYSVLQDSRHHDLLPWLMVALAAIYLGLMRAPQTRTASAIHLSLAVVFLTIAIPLKASGHWITVSWLAEGLALMWVAARMSAAKGGETTDAGTAHAARVLRPLATASLLLGFCGVCVHAFGLLDIATLSLWNKGTGTALTGIVVFAAVTWIAARAAALSREEGASWAGIAAGAVLLIDVIAAVLTLRELGASWRWESAHPAFRSADFATALIGLAVFAGVIAVSLRLGRERTGDAFWVQCGALSTIAFNLIAVLTGVREVSAAFAPLAGEANMDAALQQALAISAWLMLYGALLLAVGFWRRSGFLRWQALALLAVTIVKAFVYDMRDLSGGYRFVSFVTLGAVLMAVSFAYQKDWLGLRGDDAARRGDGGPVDPGSAPPNDAAATGTGSGVAQ